MSPRRLAVLAIMIPTIAAAQGPGPLKYPDARRGDTVETLHGRAVPDPYRWLEDPNSDETKAWVKAENLVTESYLEQVPGRAEDQGAPQAALELRALRHAVTRRRLVHLRQERRPAEPVGHLQDPGARRAGRDPDRPQRAVERRHGGTRQPLVQRRRDARGVLGVGQRIRLARMARPRRRHGPRSARRPQVGQVQLGGVAQGRLGLLLHAGTTRRRKARNSPASTSSRRCTSTSWARRRTPTRWSTSARTSPTGASAPTSPTTGGSC